MFCKWSAGGAKKKKKTLSFPPSLSAAHNGGSRLDNPEDYEEHDP